MNGYYSKITDEDKEYRPYRYEVNRWGFKLIFEFPVVKLTDYEDRLGELESTNNPFGIIVLAHFRSLETKKDYEKRLFWKISLIKRLYDKGYSRKEILNLYRFIDWLMVLPDELSLKFHDKIMEYEEERKMAYITTAEKIGIQKGVKQGIQQGVEQGIQQGVKQGLRQGLRQGLLEAISLGLELKFGEEGLGLYRRISQIDSPEKLEDIKKAIRTAGSCKEIEELIP